MVHMWQMEKNLTNQSVKLTGMFLVYLFRKERQAHGIFMSLGLFSTSEPVNEFL
jgi:hypothetical protein